jgi:hypothetical protein
MRSSNRRNRAVAGSRIHRSMETRAICVPEPRPDQLDRELARIMAPRPRSVAEELPGRKPTFLGHAAAVVSLGVLRIIAAAAMMMTHVRFPAAVILLVSRLQNRLKGLSVSRLTDLAMLLAGRCRPALRDEWRAHLAGESGHDPVTWPKVGQALGFVAAAIQFRLADTAVLAWRLVDVVLRSRALSDLFVGGPIIVTTAIVQHDGRFGLAVGQQLTALGMLLYGVLRTGRWWRGVKPDAPKAKRARE